MTRKKSKIPALTKEISNNLQNQNKSNESVMNKITGEKEENVQITNQFDQEADLPIVNLQEELSKKTNEFKRRDPEIKEEEEVDPETKKSIEFEEEEDLETEEEAEEGKEKKEKSGLSKNFYPKIAVSGIEVAQFKFFSKFYHEKHFTDAEWNKIIRWRRRKPAKLDGEDKLLYEDYLDYKIKEDELKFTEDDKKLLIEPVQKLIDYYVAHPTPGWGVLIAVLFILLPRTYTVFIED